MASSVRLTIRLLHFLVRFKTKLFIYQVYSLSKQDKINKLFTRWSRRIITPIGKNVVIKSLALPELNHLILS
jgi:hypothetical protein